MPPQLLTDKACTGAAETKEAMVALAGKLYKVAAEVVTVGDLITGSDAAVRLCRHGATTARASLSSCTAPLR